MRPVRLARTACASSARAVHTASRACCNGDGTMGGGRHCAVLSSANSWERPWRWERVSVSEVTPVVWRLPASFLARLGSTLRSPASRGLPGLAIGSRALVLPGCTSRGCSRLSNPSAVRFAPRGWMARRKVGTTARFALTVPRLDGCTAVVETASILMCGPRPVDAVTHGLRWRICQVSSLAMPRRRCTAPAGAAGLTVGGCWMVCAASWTSSRKGLSGRHRLSKLGLMLMPRGRIRADVSALSCMHGGQRALA